MPEQPKINPGAVAEALNYATTARDARAQKEFISQAQRVMTGEEKAHVAAMRAVSEGRYAPAGLLGLVDRLGAFPLLRVVMEFRPKEKVFDARVAEAEEKVFAAINSRVAERIGNRILKDRNVKAAAATIERLNPRDFPVVFIDPAGGEHPQAIRRSEGLRIPPHSEIHLASIVDFRGDAVCFGQGLEFNLADVTAAARRRILCQPLFSTDRNGHPAPNRIILPIGNGRFVQVMGEQISRLFSRLESRQPAREGLRHPEQVMLYDQPWKDPFVQKVCTTIAARLRGDPGLNRDEVTAEEWTKFAAAHPALAQAYRARIPALGELEA